MRLLIGLTVLITACSAQSIATAEPSPDPTPAATAIDHTAAREACEKQGQRYSRAAGECFGELPDPDRTPRPTPEPQTQVALVGEEVLITCGGEDCLTITVTEPSFHEFYTGDAYFNDEPEVAGNVFMQVFVEYLALDDSASFNRFDWQVFVGGRLVDDYAFVMNAPEPELSSGQLPAGRTASGWLVYEVPAVGEVILAYAPNFDGPPVFEITLREE